MNLISQYKNQILFAGIALVIFTITYTSLLLFGLTPKQFETDTVPNIFQVVGETNSFNTDSQTLDANLIPQTIIIPKIGVKSTIQVPQAVDVTTLDGALQKGAVYYPGSGTLQGGNMFLFGHSTNWRVVNNQAYKTFNDLDKLNQGDEITLTSGDTTYIYSVQTVTRTSEEDTVIEFGKGDRMLTISTCDTFGRKQDRWVVEAQFVKSL